MINQKLLYLTNIFLPYKNINNSFFYLHYILEDINNMNPANPAGGKTKPVKKVGAKMKDDDEETDAKKLANRLRQRKYREKQGKQIGAVVDDADKCDEEREELKEEKKELQDKVSTLTGLLKNCDDQVAEILKAVKTIPKMGAKSRAKSAMSAMSASSSQPSVLGKEAGKMINMAIKGKIARKRMAEAEKNMTMKILTR